jgi:glycosyltransferase involved in cell wall biosynthesis
MSLAKKSKIAFVMPGIGIENRGAEAFVIELARALRERGFDPTLFARGEANEAALPTVRVHAISRDAPLTNGIYRATRLGKKVFDTLFFDPLNIEWATAALSALPALLRGRYGVVVMEGGLVGACVARLVRRLRGSAFVDIAHGLDPKWEGAFARQRPDRVVCFTQAAEAMLRARAPRAAISVIPHGIDLERFHPQGPKASQVEDLERPLILCAGAVDAHKRMDLAVRAVSRLERGSLVILGRGPEEGAVDALAAAQLGPRRYLRTTVAREEMPRWYRAADCFTLPSRTESFGLSYLEALACGKPTVAPDDAVRREVIGDAGRFCDPERTDDYQAALAETLATNWGEIPRRRAERFPIAATIDAYAALFENLATRSERSQKRP